MKRYLPFINFILLTILIVFCCYLFKSVNHLRTDFELRLSAESQSIVDNIGVDFILGKIDSNFNLILTTITILFGLFAFLTFFGVKEQFGFQLRSMKNKSRIQERAWAKHKKDIKSLKGDLSYEVAFIRQSLNLKPLQEKATEDLEFSDYVNMVELSLIICDYYSQSLLFKSDVYPKFEILVKNIIKSILSDTSQLISTQDKFELATMGYERFLRLQKNIEQVCDIKDKQNLSLIFSKLDFPDLG